ncbi:MAG: YihY/virulence factor BrkB family protein, partial [Muribaculaceae bacterium]|nr:YihY/virulence factor BrkB family protein [Muribaculaceae bacterium]
VMLTYAAQSVFSFNFQSNINKISNRYYQQITIVIMSLIVKRFGAGEKPYSAAEIATSYDLPHSLVIKALITLFEVGYINIVEEEEDDVHRYQPAFDINQMTVASLIDAIDCHGDSNFLKSFDAEFKDLLHEIDTKYDIRPDSVVLIKDL